ncbi:MAG: glycine cleavage system protein GcvH [Bacteroidetes Order II. Incertae sedis bacterium]|jgi:glycine cleavage system H protein|nr:glycine cleavage system protein GcvH [Bacteroidetes Order II. bacterium]MDG1755442.1 glycine cleavage system protein GcvH [Rhodothermales bacterium]HAY37305.1 glycine cleavage system protein GcvH [Bacteroidota bacterium]MBT4053339.1 glycine cleavage system protein GcvH [Bacteroidetes Order II. bacterium]MBT4601629.1 glycine cleavage system protein GcvH [Bacteroidetes Order II. bacterium]
MNFPDDLYYTKDHEWLKVEGSEGTIGITDFAQSELGDIVYVDVESLDDHVEQDGVFGSVEAVKTVSDLFMPLAGKVTAFNEDLEDNPESVNDDPYGAGWLIKITLDDPSQVAELLSAADYAAMVGH